MVIDLRLVIEDLGLVPICLLGLQVVKPEGETPPADKPPSSVS